MHQYPKIQSVYKRDPETNFSTFLEGEYSLPEFEVLKDCEWIWTEKVDGTNIRVIYGYEPGSIVLAELYQNGKGRNIYFKGRTERAVIPSFLLEALQDIFNPFLPLFEANYLQASEIYKSDEDLFTEDITYPAET